MNLNFFNPYTPYTPTQNDLNMASNCNNFNQFNQQYVLVCGNKNEWDEFLDLNYGLTEKDIFDDYKIYLEAKASQQDDKRTSKLNKFKEQLSGHSGLRGDVDVGDSKQSVHKHVGKHITKQNQQNQ